MSLVLFLRLLPPPTLPNDGGSSSFSSDMLGGDRASLRSTLIESGGND
jgi:hypothetical protein